MSSRSFDAGAAALDGGGQRIGVAGLELEHRAIKETGGVGKGGVGVVVNEGVREIARESLGGDEVGDVTAGDQQGAFGSEEVGQFRFQFAVEDVVAGGQAGGGDVEAEFLDAGLQGSNDPRVAGEAEVVAAGEVGELALTEAHAGAVNLLKRLGLGHGGNL